MREIERISSHTVHLLLANHAWLQVMHHHLPQQQQQQQQQQQRTSQRPRHHFHIHHSAIVACKRRPAPRPLRLHPLHMSMAPRVLTWSHHSHSTLHVVFQDMSSLNHCKCPQVAVIATRFQARWERCRMEVQDCVRARIYHLHPCAPSMKALYPSPMRVPYLPCQHPDRGRQCHHPQSHPIFRSMDLHRIPRPPHLHSLLHQLHLDGEG